MIYNFYYDIAAFLIFFLMYALKRLFYENSDFRSRLFLHFLALGATSCLLDIFTSMNVSNIPEWYNTLLKVANMGYLFLSTLMAMAFAAYIYVPFKKEVKQNFIFSLVVFIITIVIIGINGYTGFIYSIVDGQYIEGKYEILTYIMPFILYVQASCVIIRHHEEYETKVFVSCISIIIIPVIAAFFQQLFPSEMLCMLACAITGMMIFFSLETPEYVQLQKTKKELEESKEFTIKARVDAEEANKTKSRFLANMTHEIRTPINAIMGLDEMILRETRDSKITDYAEKIQAASNLLLNTVNDILDFSRIESGKMKIFNVEYDLSELVLSLYDGYQQKMNEKKLDFSLEIDEDLPTVLYGDDVRIKQIINTLLDNAWKYTQEGSVVLSMKTLQRFTNENHEYVTIHVSVKDTGIGIKDEDKGKLFKLFQRVDDSLHSTVEGSGLGLTISSSLLRLMSSQLEVDSVYSKGTDFYFDLTQEVMGKDLMGDIKKRVQFRTHREKEIIRFTAPHAKILLVDDNDLNLFVVKKLLQRTRVKIKTASSGQECLEIASKESFDVILMDQVMPNMDGIETTNELRKIDLCEWTPIVILTANSVSDQMQLFLDKGFSGALTKPIVPEKLEELLIELLPAKYVKLSKEVK